MMKDAGEPGRLRDARDASLPAGLADALAGASLAHQPTAVELADLRRSLAVALAGPAAEVAVASAEGPRLRGAWKGPLATAVLVVGGGVLWFGLAATKVASPSLPATPGQVPAAIVASPADPAAPAVAPGTAAAPATRPPLDLRSPQRVPGRAARRPEEIGLLSRAQQALVAQPALAFTLAERHRRLFPDGLLAQEREVIAIEALRGLQRTAEAEARAQRFRARYPRSAHLPRVERQRP